MVIRVGIVQTYAIWRAGQTTCDGVSVHRYRISDRYSAARYGLERWLVRGFIQLMMERYLKRRPRLRHDSRGNMARWWAYLPPAMRQWRRYMPGGVATHITYHPDAPVQPDGVRLDPVTRRFFRHSLDATGLRSRAYLLMEIVSRQLETSDGPFRWVSLGAGTGIVACDYLTSLSPRLRRRLQVVLVDRDPAALRHGREHVRRQHLGSVVQQRQLDITRARDLAGVLRGRPQLVDALGVVEYLDESAAAALAGRVYGALAVGGRFVFSNMAANRPQLAVHRHALGWPGVIVRRPRQIMQFLSAAGIPAAAVTFLMADDGMYYICEVTRQ